MISQFAITVILTTAGRKNPMFYINSWVIPSILSQLR